MSDPTPTVFVIDDDDSFLTSIARLLRSTGLSVKIFSSGSDFLAQRPPGARGCVVTDLQMPGMTGMELQAALAKSDNPLPILFLTGQGDIPTSVKAMRHGAEDFLTKRAREDELLAAVQRALARDFQEREQLARQRDAFSQFESLTPREREVLTHVLRGHLNKQIAANLGMHERSVKRHRARLMAKLEVQSVAELARLAVQVGFGGN